MLCGWVLQRGHSGDGCDLASTLCKYDLRKGNLFVLSWARVRRMRQGSISSELLVCGGGVRSILLLLLVARCLETIDVCIWRMFVFMSVVRVRRVRWGSLSSELLMCGGGVRSILLLLLVARCLETIDVCIWRMFVFMSVVRVRRVRRGSLSSELLMCGGGVRSILLLLLVARCLETIDVCIWRMFVFTSVVETVWRSVGMFVV